MRVTMTTLVRDAALWPVDLASEAAAWGLSWRGSKSGGKSSWRLWMTVRGRGMSTIPRQGPEACPIAREGHRDNESEEAQMLSRLKTLDALIEQLHTRIRKTIGNSGVMNELQDTTTGIGD